MPGRTPSQTIGPFFHEALRWHEGGNVAFAKGGKRIVITGRITDGEGEAVSDALIETWQRMPEGCPDAPAQGAANPYGFGRLETAPDGTFRIETSMPAGEAPSIDVAIFSRGLLKPLRTRVYLAPAEKLRADPVIKVLGDSARVKTLVAAQTGDSDYRWNIRLQGEGETVFFAF
jgi:protocatechuate 3,4-dioxygenase alpha subunit